MMEMNELSTGIAKGVQMAKRGKDVSCLYLVILFIAVIFCNGSSLCAADGAVSNEENRFIGLSVSDGLMFFNEMVSESGPNYVKARKVHAELFHVCLEARKADYVKGSLSTGLLEDYTSLDVRLSKRVADGVADPNAWAKTDIEDVSKELGEIISSFEPHLQNPFEREKPRELGDKCEDILRAALNGVRVELREYIKLVIAEADNSVLLRKAEDLCEANRRAIVLSFVFRFVDFDGRREKPQTSEKQVDMKMLKQFQGDINRTIYWNRILRKKLKDSHPTSASRLLKYSNSELRRLKVLRAVLNKDMKEAQSLLLVAFRISHPLKETVGSPL